MEDNVRYSGLILNDTSAAPGFCVSFFVQGCPHHCPGCYNPETWDFNGGKEFTEDVLEQIISGLTKNGIQRNLCIMGGEPLCRENAQLTFHIVHAVRKRVPEAKIYIWTGYTIEEIENSHNIHPKVYSVLQLSDYLIDGPYIAAERDISLPMRGSRNQRIIDLSKNF